MNSERAWRIATHESSHCVIARKLKLPICGGASIIEPDAHAVFSNDCGERSIMTLMAGAAAETVAFGDYDRVGVRSDLQRWRARLCGHDEKALWDRTLALVRQNIGCVESLASMLRHAGTLDGGAIDRIIG
jgi:hypothetical protein